MAGGGRVSKLAVWRERMGRYRGSGLTVARFCRREGVSPASFYYWRRRLKNQPGETVGRKAKVQPSQGDACRPGCEDEPPVFQPVRITPAGVPVSIHLADGARIDVPPGELDALRTVLGEFLIRSSAAQASNVSPAAGRRQGAASC